ncbi:MAG: 16S rRNA (guanine(527)-N(7))-methyltransferase RsmG [Planctomycetes bacterium]|nr:16S rRNA (guanine(527)-N(7))-methyltransferase RsmG [Planctomycetota bacterium]
MNPIAIPDFVPAELEKLGVKLPDGAIDRLALYLALLLDANERFNLTGIREPEAAWRRHIIDSLTVLPGLEEFAAGARMIDVGSGGGLPGIPLAIARPDMEFTLLEATGKKANFLRECAKEIPLPNVSVVQDRAENVGQAKKHREAYDAAVCRALGPMRELLEYTLPLVKVEGLLFVMKGPKVEEELGPAADAMTQLGAGEFRVHEAYPEGFGQNTVIVVIEKASPTPRAFPRLPGVPRQTPL